MQTLKVSLVVGAQSVPGNPYDGHTLHGALEQAVIPFEVKPLPGFVDRDYRGVAIPSVQVWKLGQWRGVTWTHGDDQAS